MLIAAFAVRLDLGGFQAAQVRGVKEVRCATLVGDLEAAQVRGWCFAAHRSPLSRSALSISPRSPAVVVERTTIGGLLRG